MRTRIMKFSENNSFSLKLNHIKEKKLNLTFYEKSAQIYDKNLI